MRHTKGDWFNSVTVLGIIGLLVLIIVVTIPFLDGYRARSDVREYPIEVSEGNVTVKSLSGMTPLDDRQFVVTSTDSALIIENKTTVPLFVTIQVSVLNSPCSQNLSMTLFWEGEEVLGVSLTPNETQAQNTVTLKVNAEGFNVIPNKAVGAPCSLADQSGIVYGSIRIDGVDIKAF